ncbi:MAG: hypothetical protein HY351_05535 [Candidatus Omnitrophica bacterium]|nr:hypothetical protein [Candidatus Omnitrophota bacterium]
MVKKIALITLSIVAVLFLSVVGLVLSNHFWLRYVLAAGISQVTGFPAEIQKTNLNLKDSKFGIYGLQVQNPSGFPKSHFVSVPEIFVDFDLGPFMTNRKLYIRELRLNIEEVSVIKNQTGESNISRLASVRKAKTGAQQQEQELEKAKSSEELKFFVETLVLTIRRVRYQDQTNPLIGEKTIDLRVDQEVVRGLSSPADIVHLIVLRVIYKVALGNLGVPVDLLKGQLDASLAKGQALALQSTALAREFGTQAVGDGRRILEEASQKVPVSTAEVEQIVSGTTEKAKDIFGSATNLLKNTAQLIEDEAKSAASSN